MGGSDGVHVSHCCVIHGCKYNEEDCPVSNGLIKQTNPCWDCIAENTSQGHRDVCYQQKVVIRASAMFPPLPSYEEPPMALKDYSDEELMTEMNRRKALETAPVMLDNPNYDAIRNSARGVIDEIIQCGCMDDDTKHYMYETVMEAFYGKDIWKWKNTHDIG